MSKSRGLLPKVLSSAGMCGFSVVVTAAVLTIHYLDPKAPPVMEFSGASIPPAAVAGIIPLAVLAILAAMHSLGPIAFLWQGLSGQKTGTAPTATPEGISIDTALDSSVNRMDVQILKPVFEAIRLIRSATYVVVLIELVGYIQRRARTLSKSSRKRRTVKTRQ